MGMYRTFTTEIRYASPKFLGLRLLYFKLEQEISKITVILMNGPSKDSIFPLQKPEIF